MLSKLNLGKIKKSINRNIYSYIFINRNISILIDMDLFISIRNKTYYSIHRIIAQDIILSILVKLRSNLC